MKVSISIPDKMMDQIDEIANDMIVPNRSHVIQEAIKEFLMKYEYNKEQET